MIKPSKFVSLAQELVEASSALLRNRTINIMDMEGIIIASTEHERIGTLHTGARKVAQTGENLAISKEDVPLYPGAKEGYNMPLVVQGQMIGVIGMYGEPEDVMDLAMLLKVYASRYFELEETVTRKLQSTEIKNRLFQMLLDGNLDKERFQDQLKRLGISSGFPQRPIVIRRMLEPEMQASSCEWELQMLATRLKDQVLINSHRDLWGISGDCLVIDMSQCGGDDGNIDAVRKQVERLAFPCRVVCGRLADDLESLSKNLNDAIWGVRNFNRKFVDLEKTEDMFAYMILHEASLNIRSLEPLMEEIEKKLRREDLELALESAEAYYREDRSVTRAAEKLFIHKNTLQNRVKRLTEGTALSRYTPFEQECIIRFLIEHYRA